MLMIDDPEIERRIREEAARTGQPPEEVLRSILAAVPPAAPRSQPTPVSPEERARRLEVIREAQERVARLHVLDARPMNDLLGYDESGLPS
jgi:hypothetical protein